MDDINPDTLPDDKEQLKAMLIEANRALEVQRQKFRELQLEVDKLTAERLRDRAKRFAAQSEQGQYQYAMFDEVEHCIEQEGQTLNNSDSSGETIDVASHQKRKPGRKPLPKDLPRVDVHHDLSEEQKHCHCGQCMTQVGEEVSEQLDIIPAQVFVLRHIQAKYVCRQCDSAPITAPKSQQPIPGSMASAGLLAHVAISKYADGLPLYRQSGMFKRAGVDLSRQTLANHMMKAGELITPMVNLLYDKLLDHDIIQMDETRTQVLKEPGKPAQSQSWMWVMTGGQPEQPVVLFHYDPSRSQRVPERLLSGYEGYLQTDGYAGYSALTQQSSIQGLGCWAHVRRKYIEALNGLPKKDRQKGGRIQQALAYISKLYQLETRHKDSSVEERLQARQEHAMSTLKTFKQWLDKQSVVPNTLLGKAVRYTLNEWSRLIIYCEDGRLSIDNNGVENKIRPFAVGRKNWLFSDSQRGARTSAALYSLIETAKAIGVNEYAYLKWLFTRLPACKSIQDFESLLPWCMALEDIRAMTSQPKG